MIVRTDIFTIKANEQELVLVVNSLIECMYSRIKEKWSKNGDDWREKELVTIDVIGELCNALQEPFKIDSVVERGDTLYWEHSKKQKP